MIASLCYVATWEVVYFNGFMPDFSAKYQAHELERARAAGASEADESTTGPASFVVIDPDGNPILVDQHV